jgi:DNA polymerase-4
VAERELAAMGLLTVGDLVCLGRPRLARRLGASGGHLWELAQGIDERPVVPWHDPKSIGAEETFGRDTGDVDRLRAALLGQAERVAAELRASGLRGRTVTLKLRFADFRTVTRQDTRDTPTADAGEVFRRAWAAFVRVPRPRAVRLIGLAVSGLGPAGGVQQLALLGEDPVRAERLGRVADELRARFGARAIVRASLLAREGTGARHP